MATIAENLQILKDSTDDIRQAILNKGGEITGDITTWAEAIEGISGGNDENIEINNVYVSIMTNYVLAPGSTEVNVFCSLEKPLDTSMLAYIVSSDGEQTQIKSYLVMEGSTEFEFTSVIANEYNLNTSVSVMLSNFYGLRQSTKYIFKYNYL